MANKSTKLFRRTFPLVMCLLVSCQRGQLHTADLLFHVPPTQNAITSVTPGLYDHVAIVLSKDSVIEAIGRGVTITPLDSLLKQEGHYIIGRVRHADCRQSVRNARRYVGRHYDHLYLSDNDDIYCSELVLLSFVDHHGKPLFTTVPMTFRDSTGNIPDHWLHLYTSAGLDVPEGKPGSNPSELSKRSNVHIIGKLRCR